MTLDVVKLTKDLVGYNSVSQLSNVLVTRHVSKVLKSLGFAIEELPYTDANGMDKLSIVGKLGQGQGGLTLGAHRAQDHRQAQATDGALWHGRDCLLRQDETADCNRPRRYYPSAYGR